MFFLCPRCLQLHVRWEDGRFFFHMAKSGWISTGGQTSACWKQGQPGQLIGRILLRSDQELAMKCKASVLCYYLSISISISISIYIYIHTWYQIHWILAFQCFFHASNHKKKMPFSENSSQLLIFLTFFPQETYSWAQCRTSQQSWLVVEHQETASVYLDETKFTQLRMIKFPTSEVESLSQGFIHLCKTSGFLQWSKQTCRSRTYLCHFGVLGNIYL